MTEWFGIYQTEIRFASFITVFCIMALLEWLSPSRLLIVNKTSRWFNNLALIFTSVFLIRWAAPFALTGVAFYAQEQNAGLFNLIELPISLSIMLSIIIMDGAIYAQHRMMHVVPILWRLHRLHHSDLDYDVTTAVRFHPIEMLMSFFIKAGLIIVLGTPLIAVVIFEVLLSSLAMFNHANINLPKPLEKVVRLLIVTPDVHRIHHSVLRHETNSNYGFNLIIWDKLFGSFTAESEQGDDKIKLGLDEFTDKSGTTQYLHLLIQPLK